jgi:hypothetical protein
MVEKIICEYCNVLMYKTHKKRHQLSKRCEERRVNIINNIAYDCKYCKKKFNLNNYKIKHELICTAKDICYEFELYKEKKEHELENKKKELLSYKENKDKELENKDKIYQNIIDMKNNDINKQDDVIIDLRNQLYVLQKTTIETKHVTNNTYINNVNINFNEIQNHLDKYTINVLSNKDCIIKFILDIFINRLVLVDKKKKIIGYYHDNKNRNDIKCKRFLKLCVRQLIEPNNRLCNTHNGIIENDIMNKAQSNKRVMFSIIDNIDLFVRKLEGKSYIEYIINGINNHVDITDEIERFS